MIIPTTKDDLERLIQDGVEESQQLEYKAAKALQNKEISKDRIAKNVAKDVSAMANSSGGIIIYGIAEHDSSDNKHLPATITPIERASFSKEQLEQIINSNITPKIEGLLVHPVPLEATNEVAYVVEIPQGQTAHQSTKDFIYYKRRNFEILPMLDYEIRDVMNRLKYPKIGIEFEIEMHLNPKSLPDSIDVWRSTYQTSFILKISLVNEGNQFAKYINYFLELPSYIVDEKVAKGLNRVSSTTVQYTGENIFRDVVGETLSPTAGATLQYGPSRFAPLLPGLKGKADYILLTDNFNIGDGEISWKVYADNAPQRVGTIKLNAITVTRKYNY